MARIPNVEQASAIFKKNGLMLSAGAGSGKTFVIIEHLVFLIEDFRNKNKAEVNSENVGKFLGKIVLMTFTKKASGEMRVRLINRIEQKVSEVEHDEFWQIVLININRVQISTIHGFCHGLINSGVWNYLPNNIELLDKFSQREKIKTLYQEWVQLNKSELSDVFLAHLSDLFKSIHDIFISPDLRLIWKNGSPIDSVKNEIDDFFREYLTLCDFKYLFNEKISVSRDATKLKKTGFQFLAKFEDVFLKLGSINYSNFEEYLLLFESLKQFPRKSDDMSDIEILLINEIRILFDFLKKAKSDFRALFDFYDSFKNWELMLKSAFNYVESNYLRIPGLSFADLEYYVSNGLQSSESRKKINDRFNYFIVDEFQDTSFIQYEIIRNCIDNDFTKLFCVGDKKQAIYGFRGGELKVFEDCSSTFGSASNMTLKYNYRSTKDVVEFNNYFFSKLLPLGAEYSGADGHTINMEEQVTPEHAENGDVEEFKVNINSENSSIDIDLVESQAIFEILKAQVKDDSIRSIAVLYRKLRPSHSLIDLLRDSQISFSAQIKIKIDDDPIVTLYEYFLKYLINKNDEKKKADGKFLIDSTLTIIGIMESTYLVLDQFVFDASLLGINVAFWKSLYDLGISNAHYLENAKLLDDISLKGKNDPKLISYILSNQDDDYSFEMITGINKKIHILSTHASKGLEYDSVILGGIHKNGRYEGLKSKIGNFPKSFKWKNSFDQKNYFKSPQYYLESEVLKRKDFSESKRLLYVACTRAVKKLSYVNIALNDKDQSLYPNSWINAFRIIQLENIVKNQCPTFQLKNENSNISIMLKDQMGIVSVNRKRNIAVVPELSVTRLAVLADCPFKFYLKNICKIEMNSVKSDVIEPEDFQGEIFYSSKKRGTEIHSNISDVICGKIKTSEVKKEIFEAVEWTNEFFTSLKYEKFYSEKELKFSFFGQMISAIPDLIGVSKNSINVLDFKTGMRDESDEDSYWFQLMAYAYGFFKSQQFDQDITIELKLLYVDQKTSVSKLFKFKELNDYLFNIWLKVESLDQTNLKHCHKCEYSSICPTGCKTSTPVASL